MQFFVKQNMALMELLDNVIRLGDPRELGRQGQHVGNKTSEKVFAGGSSGPSNNKHKKHKYEQKEDQEGGSKNISKSKARKIDTQAAKEKGACFKCGKPDHFAKNCSNKAKVIALDTLVEENPALEGPLDKGPRDEVAENELPLDKGNLMLKSINLRLTVEEGGFQASLSVVNRGRKGLVYLWAKVAGSHIAMLLDTGATNSFMTSDCARRLKLVVQKTAQPVKVSFAQGSCQAAEVVKGVFFKADGRRRLHDL